MMLFIMRTARYVLFVLAACGGNEASTPPGPPASAGERVAAAQHAKTDGGPVARSALALSTVGGDHLGFVLLANPGAAEGDCVLMVLPKKPELFESPVYKRLVRWGHREAGECRCSLADGRVAISGRPGELIFAPDTAGGFVAQLPEGNVIARWTDSQP